MAMVMPNGLLNNTSLAYFRKAILDKAQLLAVVDMHRDLFQPKNDTQTSMVLLRKWGNGETAETHPADANLHAPLIRDFATAILADREPLVNGEIGRMVAAIEEEIYG